MSLCLTFDPGLSPGVICAMEAALDHLELGSLEGKTVAIQGAGNVGKYRILSSTAKPSDFDVQRVKSMGTCRECNCNYLMKRTGD